MGGCVRADLPVHCIRSEVEGAWKLKVGPDTTGLSCGHTSPDDFKVSIEHPVSYDEFLPGGTELQFNLMKDFKQSSICIGPKCAMVKSESMLYDEGFRFYFTGIGNGKELIDTETYYVLIFFKYLFNGKVGENMHLGDLEKFQSSCGKTIPGWIVPLSNRTSYLCAIAEKVEDVALHSSEMRTAHISTGLGPVSPVNLLELNTGNSVRENAQLRIAIRSKMKLDEMVESMNEEEFMNSLFTVSDEYLASANAANMGYTVSRDSVSLLEGRTNRQVLRMMGHHSLDQRTKRHFSAMKTSDEEVLEAHWLESTMNLMPEKLVVDDNTWKTAKKSMECTETSYPENFSWRDEAQTGCQGIMSEVVNQGNCGSCYAISLADAMTMRFRLFTSKDASCSTTGGNQTDFKDPSPSLKFSAQDILDCSPENQHCDGGYPLAAAHFAFSEGLRSLDKNPYKEKKQTCTSDGRDTTYRIRDYKYVGGSYGVNIHEGHIKRDLVENGPISIALDAPGSLMGYSDGVFESGATCKQVLCGVEDMLIADGSYWMKTNHALVLVGYGVQEVSGEQVPYWEIKNSWGSSWGDHGFFKIRRMANVWGIETMPVGVYFQTPNPETGDFKFVYTKSEEYVDKYKTCMTAS